MPIPAAHRALTPATHRPSRLHLTPLRLRLQRESLLRPCDGRLQAVRKRLGRRFVEAMLTGLATTFLNSLALAHPAVLHDAPATTWQRLITPQLDGGAASGPLIDCP